MVGRHLLRKNDLVCSQGLRLALGFLRSIRMVRTDAVSSLYIVGELLAL